MKTLHVFLFSLSLHVFLFAPAATEARSLLTLEKWSRWWFMKGAGSEGRHIHPPLPTSYYPGLLKRSPPHSPSRHHSPPPPVPGYSPGPIPGLLRSPPRPFNNVIIHPKSLPIPYAASA